MLKVTPNHPIFIEGFGYKPAGNLIIGDKVLLYVNNAFVAVPISNITTIKSNETVYNLEVSGEHNYFANGVVVHNKTPNQPSIPEKPPATSWFIYELEVFGEHNYFANGVAVYL